MNARSTASRRVIAGASLLAASSALAQTGGPYTLTWSTIDGGGSTGASGGGSYAVAGTAGQPDAGAHAGGAYAVLGGYWAGASGGCYANCDGSTLEPVLTPADFVCFLQRFRAGDPYANCDGSTASPTLTPADFVCFLQRFRASC